MTAEPSPPANHQPGIFYCANHPDKETTLRCNRCEKPICTRCAVLTPTGYRCKECVRGQQKVFETAQPQDYIIGPLIAGVLAFLGSLLTGFLGWFVLFLAAGVGAGIAELVRSSIRRRRGRNLFILIAAATAIGGLLPTLPSLLALFLFPETFNFGLLWNAAYIFIVTTTVYYRLAGIRL